MSSLICGACGLSWHTKRDTNSGFSGQIWAEQLGYHMWQAPSKDQIKQRLKKRYGLI